MGFNPRNSAAYDREREVRSVLLVFTDACSVRYSPCRAHVIASPNKPEADKRRASSDSSRILPSIIGSSLRRQHEDTHLTGLGGNVHLNAVLKYQFRTSVGSSASRSQRAQRSHVHILGLVDSLHVEILSASNCFQNRVSFPQRLPCFPPKSGIFHPQSHLFLPFPSSL